MTLRQCAGVASWIRHIRHTISLSEGPRRLPQGALRPVHRRRPMDLEKYTERSKGFVQSAQNLALRSGHQRLAPDHLAKVLLEDKEGLCANLIRAAGGDPRIVLAAVDAELNKQPKVEGSGAGQVYLGPELARVVDEAEKIAEKAGDSYVTVERLLLALA